MVCQTLKSELDIKPGNMRAIITLNLAMRWIACGMAILALGACLAMLIGNEKPKLFSMISLAALSAVPLLLVGASFLMLQVAIRPRWVELLKNGLLGGTFLLWGTIQLMPSNATSLRLGNIVIGLYVLDLAWVILGSRSSTK